MGARNRVGIVLSYLPARNWFLESILGLLKSSEIRAQITHSPILTILVKQPETKSLIVFALTSTFIYEISQEENSLGLYTIF